MYRSAFLTFIAVCCHLSTATNIINGGNFSVGDVKRISMVSNTIYSFTVSQLDKTTGVIFQLHSQLYPLTLSTSADFTYGNTASGNHVGLWNPSTPTSSSTPFLYYAYVWCEGSPCNNTLQVPVLAAVTSIEYEAPLPGGCNLVSPLDIDPNVRLNFTAYTTTVTFQDGNQGYTPTNNGTAPPLCTEGSSPSDFPVNQLSYSIYRKILPDEDYSSDVFFDALEEVLKNDLKKDNGLPHASKSSFGIKTVTVDSFSGDGAVYVVMAISSINGKSSAYVPSVTYACSMSSAGMCQNSLSIINVITCILLGLLGLFLCFFAHRFFHVEVLIFSWVILTFGLFILDSALVPASHTVLVSAALVIGLILSLLLFLVWFFSGYHLPFIFLFNGASGFLVAAILLYTPFGSLSIWQINYVYGLFIGCIMVLFLIPAVIAPRASNIFSSSLVGGYLIVFAIGLFVFTTIDEIVLKVVKSASVSGYLGDQEAYAFMLNDILLACGWGILLLLGMLVQALLARKRDPFPQESLLRKLTRKLEERHPHGEQRKLLKTYVNSPSHSEYGAFNY